MKLWQRRQKKMRSVVVSTCEFEISASIYPEKISEVSWAPSEAIVNLARQIAANKASTLLSHGMGPNHFFFRLSPTAVYRTRNLTIINFCSDFAH